ncbi:type I-E CRISPR-associated protein Cse2/CasB [Kitasatospora sp. NBC_00240]|uniref:hypothetical protein n=1 Tax=Kitasatospora sp. NBC_00240 TaxID=2903567 RepID=UPI00225BF7E7|nr:hypothetical protein [Kitasatospora sp. NBC_00240]MCX5208926.1 type I-E CRISPR-associated protein Cse2/CasB [Kitasatospora sp. NBC_00240]
MDSKQATRTLRAAIFAALVVLLAALGQVLVTGRPLPVAVLALAGGAVFALALALAGRGRGFVRIAAVFLPLQLALSALFDLAQTTCGPGSGTGPHVFEPLVCRGGSVGAFLVGNSSLAGNSGLAGDGGLLGHGAASAGVPTAAGGVLLLLVHTLIALFAAFWLRRADAALTGLAEALRTLRDFLHSRATAAVRRLLRLLTAPVPARPVVRVPLPPSSREHLPVEDVLLGPAVRRGPPVLAPAC